MGEGLSHAPDSLKETARSLVFDLSLLALYTSPHELVGLEEYPSFLNR